MVAIVVALASTIDAAALRDKEINLIRELASELANDLRNNKDIVKQAETENPGMGVCAELMIIIMTTGLIFLIQNETEQHTALETSA